MDSSFDPKRGHPFSRYENFPKNYVRTCTYQGVRNVSFSENFAYVLNGWSQNVFIWSFSVTSSVCKNSEWAGFKMLIFCVPFSVALSFSGEVPLKPPKFTIRCYWSICSFNSSHFQLKNQYTLYLTEILQDLSYKVVHNLFIVTEFILKSVKPLTTDASLVQKPVNWFAAQIN